MNETLDIAKLSDLEFYELFSQLVARIAEDPLRYFVQEPMLMNFTPSVAQRVALKVIFGQKLDGTVKYPVSQEDVDELGQFTLVKQMMTEIELYEFMTDDEYDPLSDVPKNRIDLIVGRRAGKSTLSSILSVYFAIIRNWKPFLKKHPYATVLVLSHSREFSEEILDLIRSFINESPVLIRLLDQSRDKKSRKTLFNLAVPFRREEDQRWEFSKVVIQVGAASKKTVRGKATVVVLCDEIAFWNLAEKSADKDDEILRALRPALMQFKQYALLIKLSSPGIKQGMLYKEYQQSRKLAGSDKLPPNYVVFKAPTWVWNDIIEEREFREELAIDPHGFGSEYRGDFIDSISNFISPEFVDLCKVSGVIFQTAEPKEIDVVYHAAIDAAFKKDRFTFTIVGAVRGKIKQYVMRAWSGTRIKPVKAKDVADYVQKMSREYGFIKVLADQYAFQPLKEIFLQYGVELEEKTFTNSSKKQIFFNYKSLIHSQKIDLLDNEELINETKQLIVEQSDTGTVRIGHPPGGHDDHAVATAVATYAATEQLTGSTASLAVAGEDDATHDPDTRVAAPQAENLAEVMGLDFQDNSQDYVVDKFTGKLRRRTEKDDEEEGESLGSGSFDFVF